MRTVTKNIPYLTKSEKGIIGKEPVPYDGREDMFLCFEQTEQESANLEDESKDDLRVLGISHLKVTRLA